MVERHFLNDLKLVRVNDHVLSFKRIGDGQSRVGMRGFDTSRSSLPLAFLDGTMTGLVVFTHLGQS